VKHGLVPLICVGETLTERNSGQADAVLALQVQGALQFLEGEAKAAAILFAYEPVWAIGDKGIPASSDYADRQHALIKKIAGDLLPAVPPVLYGGSVNPRNAAELVRQPHVDGLFIGRSAWQAEGYIDILERALAAL
jgi:triosephosphate isomerase